jgi:hypothetical protein
VLVQIIPESVEEEDEEEEEEEEEEDGEEKKVMVKEKEEEEEEEKKEEEKEEEEKEEEKKKEDEDEDENDPKCPGCVELELWNTNNLATFYNIYPPAVVIVSEEQEGMPEKAKTSVCKFVPQEKHLVRCPKKPSRTSGRQQCDGAWHWDCDKNTWSSASGKKSTAKFFDMLGQANALAKFQKAPQYKKKSARKGKGVFTQLGE